MGLGKTVMCITLILKGLETDKENAENWLVPGNRRRVPSKATLVVCPMGCIGQWKSELETKAKRMNVAVFHGPKRTDSAALLSQNDVVLTTYSTLRT